jgi:hypothetical protein
LIGFKKDPASIAPNTQLHVTLDWLLNDQRKPIDKHSRNKKKHHATIDGLSDLSLTAPIADTEEVVEISARIGSNKSIIFS